MNIKEKCTSSNVESVWMTLGWHVELDQRYVKSLLDAMGMNELHIDGRSRDRRNRSGTLRVTSWTRRNFKSSDQVLESVSI